MFCDDLVKVFYEDLYLVDSTGRVISSREGSDRGIQNIFSIFTDSKEMTFLRDNVLIPGRHSFFLLSTCEGPVLLYCPLFLKKRVFLAIIPRISEGEVLSLIKNSLSTLILASPRMAEKLNEVSSFELNDQSRAFGRGLVAMHRLKSYSDTHGKTNDELAEMILDVSASIMDYLGCEIDWEIKGLGIFEMKNEICFDSYQHLLIALCLLIREYSSARSAKASIIFNEYGILFKTSFKIATQYCEIDLTKSPVIEHLLSSERMHGTVIDFVQCDGSFMFGGYPWKNTVESEYIKQDPPNFIYS